jgi:hypothetical protein
VRLLRRLFPYRGKIPVVEHSTKAALGIVIWIAIGLGAAACASEPGNDPSVEPGNDPSVDAQTGEVAADGEEGAPGQTRRKGARGEEPEGGPRRKEAEGEEPQGGPKKGEVAEPMPKVGHGDPLLGIPDGAEEFVTGPRLRGTIVNGEDISPLAGFTVVEHGVSNAAPPVVTARDGVFLVQLRDEATPAFKVTRDGWVPTIMLTSDQGRLYFKGEYKIEMFERADEDAAHLADMGTPRDWSLARVLINFQPMGFAGKVRAELGAPGVQAHHYDAEDKLLPGDTLEEDPLTGEIVYAEVPPGEWPVTVTTPAGLDCRGPATVPAEAGTYTRAYFFCRSVEDWKADPGGQSEFLADPGGDGRTPDDSGDGRPMQKAPEDDGSPSPE